MISARGRSRSIILTEIENIKKKIRSELDPKRMGHLRWNLYELVKELERAGD